MQFLGNDLEVKRRAVAQARMYFICVFLTLQLIYGVQIPNSPNFVGLNE